MDTIRFINIGFGNTVNAGKIIRPAYKYVGHHAEYVDRDMR